MMMHRPPMQQLHSNLTAQLYHEGTDQVSNAVTYANCQPGTVAHGVTATQQHQHIAQVLTVQTNTIWYSSHIILCHLKCHDMIISAQFLPLPADNSAYVRRHGQGHSTACMHALCMCTPIAAAARRSTNVAAAPCAHCKVAPSRRPVPTW
jgi:hypothetical protein